MKKTLILMALALPVHADNYGTTHGLIAAGVVGGASLLTTDPVPLGIVATATCGWFVAREMRGEGDLFAYGDRIADWVVPCGVAAGIWWGRKDKVLPWFDGDTVGVAYRMDLE